MGRIRVDEEAQTLTAAGWLILALAVALRIGYVAATPDYVMVHDALDYEVAGVERAQASERVLAARILGIVISTLIVVLTGVVAAQLGAQVDQHRGMSILTGQAS